MSDSIIDLIAWRIWPKEFSFWLAVADTMKRPAVKSQDGDRKRERDRGARGWSWAELGCLMTFSGDCARQL